MDGVYDTGLLANTGAVSGNIARPDGYVVYISDRRRDNVKNLGCARGWRQSRQAFPKNINSTNGMADNMDIYGPNGLMDGGEDVQNTGAAVGTALVKDTAELPDPAVLAGTFNATDFTSRRNRAMTVASWSNPSITSVTRCVYSMPRDPANHCSPTRSLNDNFGYHGVEREHGSDTWGSRYNHRRQ